MANNRKPPYKWVIMIYACANDEMSEEGMVNFFKELNKIGKEIDRGRSKAKIKILLQAYRDWNPSKWKSYYGKRFEIKAGFLKKGRIPPDVVYTRLYTNMGDPNALSDFIVWCKDNYKAEHYLLLLWGHGAQNGMFTGELKAAATTEKEPRRFTMSSNGNTIPYINQLTPVNKPISEQYRKPQQLKIEFKKKNSKGLVDTDMIERKIINNGTTVLPTNKDILPPTVIYYFDVEKKNRLERLKQLIPEKPTGDSLTIEEICKSLWDTGHYIDGTGNIDVLMIFGCAMQTFELAFELNKCGSLGCKYLIASEELVYWEGYDYQTSFLGLLKNPDMRIEDLCKKIIVDTKDKKAGKNPDDGHRDKATWAVSCIDIKKCNKAASLLNNISKKIMEIIGYQKTKKIKRRVEREFWEIFSDARLACHYFGEDAFVDCYIDIAWFFKSLRNSLAIYLEEKGFHYTPYNFFYTLKFRPGSRRMIKMYRQLIVELDIAIGYFGKKNLIVEVFIGEKRSEKAIWKKKILYKEPKRDISSVNSSTGAHGTTIFFPISEAIKTEYPDQKFFFVKNTDYNLEFERPNWAKKKANENKNWHSLVNGYISRNLRTSSRRADKRGHYIKNTEPDDETERSNTRKFSP